MARPAPTRAVEAAGVVQHLYRQSGGVPPSVREVCALMNLRSTQSGHAYLAGAVQLGLVKQVFRGPRSGYLPVTKECPVCGCAQRGWHVDPPLAEPRRVTLTGS